MEHPEYPPNSEVSKRQAQEKHIEQVTTGEVRRKKPSLRKQFKDTFISGSIRGSLSFVVLDVLLPAAKDMVVEAVGEGARQLFFGEGRRYRGGSTPPPSGPYGQVNYRGYSTPSRNPSAQRAMSRRARAAQNFDEIVLDSRTEAEEVIDRLYDLVGKYDTATVADLYELVGLSASHTDYKWGWADLHGAGVSRIRDGYLLDLPDPIPLD